LGINKFAGWKNNKKLFSKFSFFFPKKNSGLEKIKFSKIKK